LLIWKGQQASGSRGERNRKRKIRSLRGLFFL
jgi:hypothetical protein